MSAVKLSQDFSPPPFLPVVRVERLTPSSNQATAGCLANEACLKKRIVPAIANARSMSVVCSFLTSREHMVDAVEKAWNSAQTRSYWMISDTRMRESYSQLGEGIRSAQDRDLLADMGEMLDIAAVRFGNYHAKFVLVDPLSEAPVGFLTSANLIAEAFQSNLESFVELTSQECRQLYKIARHIFWEKAANELCEDNQLRPATAPFSAPLPSPEGELVWTVDRQSNLIREHSLRLINEATSTIDICGHSWSPDHEVLSALAKRAEDGLSVRLLGWRFGDNDRQPPIHTRLAMLINSGVEVFEVPKLHAKYLLTDKAGMMCTANFHSKGLDEGIELGLLLNEDRLAQARQAFEYFRSKAETRSYKVEAIDPAESVEGDIMVYRPEFPDTPIETQGTHTLEPKVITATCATTVKEEAQEALRSHLEALANPKDRLAAWTTQKGGNSKTPRTLNQTITAIVEVKPPTVPSKHRMPDSDPTTPQIIEHKGREWIVIPDPGKDHVLLAQAAALAKEHGCNVAFWD